VTENEIIQRNFNKKRQPADKGLKGVDPRRKGGEMALTGKEQVITLEVKRTS
jgi:hypothetical protein